MPTLLLSAPEFHQCEWCKISTHYRVSDDWHTAYSYADRLPYFVEHPRNFDGEEWESWWLCDLCQEQWQEDQDRPQIYLCRGVTPWADFVAYEGFEDVPMICVSNAPSAAWHDDTQEEHETWLFCRNRTEWREAWALARLLVQNGNKPHRYPGLLELLPAYRLPGDFDLYINEEDGEMSLLHKPFSGLCDGCQDYSINLSVWPGTQWANCPRCHEVVRSFQLAAKEVA